MDLEELLAREQIREALARYARGVDRLDLDLVLSVFHVHAIDHHGRSVGRPADIFPEIFARLSSHVAGGHYLCSSTISFESSSVAAVETYALALHRLLSNGRPRDLRIGLRYVDRFERHDDAWKIVERHVVEDWRRADDVHGDVPPSVFETGVRGPGDRSYRSGV